MPIYEYDLFKYPDYTLPLAVKMSQVHEEHCLDILHLHYAVPHATAQLMSLALPDSSVRCKRHESAMNTVMNTVLGRGSA